MVKELQPRVDFLNYYKTHCSPNNVSSNTHPKVFTCLYFLIFVSLYLISSSSASFELPLELHKTDFFLSSPKYILRLFSTNQSQILLKSLINCFFVSVTSLRWKSKHESLTFYCPKVRGSLVKGS